MSKKFKGGKLSVLALVLAVVLAFSACTVMEPDASTQPSASTPSSAPVKLPDVAMTVGQHNVNGALFHFFYYDNIIGFYNMFTSSYGEYASLYMQMYGLNISKPLNEQVYDKEKGTTWADYFVDQTKQNIVWTYAVYDEAMKNGYTISEEEQKGLDGLEATLKSYASYYGYASAEGYLVGAYGPGVTLADYQEYYRINMVAAGYSNDYVLKLEYTDEDYRNYEKDKYNHYSSYNYCAYYLTVSNYLPKQQKDGDTSTEYTQEQKDQALAAARADAAALAVSGNNTPELLNAAISALPINEGNTNAKATESGYTLYSAIRSADIRDWVSAGDRQVGDITAIESTTKDEEGNETVNGIYVVLYMGSRDNTMFLANVRHILVNMKGGVTDKNGSTTYTDADKELTKAAAQALLDQYLAGEQTEKAFADLASKYTDDTGSKSSGGLYEDITPDTNFVEGFLNWCMEEHKPGDTGIVESPYGYHVMYYVADDEMTYRDYLLKNEMTEKDYTAWEEALMEAMTSADVDLSFVKKDFVIANG